MMNFLSSKVRPNEEEEESKVEDTSVIVSGNVGTSTFSASSSSIQEISNGLCKFSPTSQKGKWIFVLQTFVLSFTPIILLIIQNSLTFYDTINWKNDIVAKDNMVVECKLLSNVILALQRERAQISLAVFLDAKSGRTTNLTKEYSNTDISLNALEWKPYGTQKIFRNKLRFQIRVDDFRQRITQMGKSFTTLNATKDDVTDTEILGFYNLATTTLLRTLEEDLSLAYSGNNWRLLMSYFNMIQLVESSGIGLVYGLRFYSKGQLDDLDIISYVKTNALLYEYYKQAYEQMPVDIGDELVKLFNSEAFIIVNTSTAQILSNVETSGDDRRARKYYEGSVTFMESLTKVLEALTNRVSGLAVQDIRNANISQIYGIFLLCFVMVLSPILLVLARNGITSIQVFAQGFAKKSYAMKKQKKKQERLVLKMLPKEVVAKLNEGLNTAEEFESATLYFSCVVGFADVTRKCTAMQVVNFLNNLYQTMDNRMDNHDVYKVETISDSYLVASGLPIRNGDKHAGEICRMALDLLAACGSVVRPDIAPRTIQMMCGIHTGTTVGGVVGSKMPRYCLFGDTINTASRMQTNSEPGMIQISNTTNMLLDMQGGFRTEERGGVEVKGKGLMQTYWLLQENERKSRKSHNKTEKTRSAADKESN